MSTGLTIKAKANIDTNIPDIGGPTEDEPPKEDNPEVDPNEKNEGNLD